MPRLRTGGRTRRSAMDGFELVEELLPEMLADAEHLEAHLIGERDLFHQVAQSLGGRQRLPTRRVRGAGPRVCVRRCPSHRSR